MLNITCDKRRLYEEGKGGDTALIQQPAFETVRDQPALIARASTAPEKQSSANLSRFRLRSPFVGIEQHMFRENDRFSFFHPFYTGSFIISCLLHEVRLQSTEFAFRPSVETEVVLKSVKRSALNDDRRRQCPSRRPTIFASFCSIYSPPFVFICCLSSSGLLGVVPNLRLEYGQLQFPLTDTIVPQVFLDYLAFPTSDHGRCQ